MLPLHIFEERYRQLSRIFRMGDAGTGASYAYLQNWWNKLTYG